MSSAAEWTERRDAALEELAELGMELAREMAGRAKAAGTTAEAERCAEAFDRLARSVRLTYSIRSRLEREARQVRSLDAASFQARSVARRKQVRAAVLRTLRADAPEREYERLVFALDQRLGEAALYEAFVDGPLAVQIERIRRDLGLPRRETANDLVGVLTSAPADGRPGPS
jgi:hypothetical protein